MQVLRCKYPGLFALILLLSSPPGFCTETERVNSLIDRLVAKQRISDVTPSPDGNSILFIATPQSYIDAAAATLWLYGIADDGTRQLSLGNKVVSAPKWSPSGDFIAFKAAVDGEPAQIQLLPSIGEAIPITSSDSGIVDYEWSPDGESIAFTATPGRAGKDSALAEPIVATEKHGPDYLYRVDVLTREVTSLLEEPVSEFAWLPDGEGIFVTTTNSYLPEKPMDRLALLNVKSGDLSDYLEIESTRFNNLGISPDGGHLFALTSSGGPTGHDLFLLNLADRSFRNITGRNSRTGIDQAITGPRWIDDNTILFSTVQGFGSSVYRISVDGSATRVMDKPDEVISSVTEVAGRLFYVKTDSTSPPELWTIGSSGERQLSEINSAIPNLSHPEIVRYKSGEFTIEAAYYEPTNAQSPHPLILLVHGGPSGRFSHQINDWAQYLVAKGYAVLAPNIRGSIGYGEEFLMANRNDWGGGDYRDAIAGIEYLVARNDADPERLGIAGWSYGGYMAAWAITQTSLFKASFSGAPMLDLGIQWGTERPGIVEYDSWFLGTPWTNPDGFRRMSPMTYVENVETPIMLAVGGDDLTDPPHQNWAFFRALRLRGISTQLYEYPCEGHVLRRRRNAIDLIKNLGRWMDRYVLGASSDTDS